jgi:hypothetical protein
LALSLAGRAFAVTDTPTLTDTRTATPTGTATPTPTPAVGQGSWNFVPSAQPLVTGNSGYTGVLTYKSGASAWPASGGLLTIFFPAGLDMPDPTNFYAAPAYAAKVIPTPVFNSRTVSVEVRNLAPGDSIAFYYGYNPTGLAVSTTISPLTFGVMSYSQDVNSGPGALVTPNGQASVAVVTPTLTRTVTATPTISATVTESPTITPTFSITQTFTQTPVGMEQANTVYSYPNPFDLKKFQKCTFRFPNAASAQVTVFNLVGEPVRQLPDADVNAAQGWAIWPGVDDYSRKVTGGLYFVRVRLPNTTMVKKFTVLH